MTDATLIPTGSAERIPPDNDGSIRRCGPRDAAAVAVVAMRCAWRRRRDATFTQGVLHLAMWPLGAILLALESHCLWVNPDQTAIVAARPTTGRRRLRLTLFLAGGVVLPMLIITGLAINIGADDQLLVVCIALMALLVAPLRRCRRIPTLEDARRSLSGPGVLEASNLLASAPGAGLALTRSLCAMADATGTTIVAEARGAARQRLYRRLGFTAVAEASGAALIVRSPQDPKTAAR